MEGRKDDIFYLMMHSIHFIYGYMASDNGMREESAAATSWATL